MTRKVPLIPVEVRPGLIVLHTPAEVARYHRGVDREAARQAVADLDEYVEKEREVEDRD